MGKKRNRDDNEDRAIAFKKWRYTADIGKGYASDLDHVEFDFNKDGSIKFLACLELTRRDPHPDYPNPPLAYFRAILDRYRKEAQGKFAVEAAAKLGCEAYLIVFDHNMSRLWGYPLSRGWREHWHEFKSQEEFRTWLRKVHGYEQD